jgi:hypothetical protein
MMKLGLVSLWCPVVFLFGCVGTSSRLLAPARAPLRPDEVEIYRTAPARYERIASLDASSGPHFFHGNEQSDAQAIARLKEAAAKVGANGVLLTLVGDEPTGAVGLGFGGGGYGSRSSGFNGEAAGSAPLVQTTAHGIAIFVSRHR